MILYSNALKRYGRVFIAIENLLLKLVVWFNVDLHMQKIREAREVAMVKSLNLLISNINECKTAQHIKNCKDMYQLLCLQYPEFPLEYGKLVGGCMDRKETKIIQSFN